MSAIKAGRAWLFSNHSPSQIPTGYDCIRAQDCLIAVDGGLELLNSLGRKPDLVIGDFDSLDPGHIPEGVLVQSFAPEKNETDMELALAWAVNQGYREIIICNDLGGRFDHALGLLQNLELFSSAENSIRIESANQVLFMLKQQNLLSYPKGSLLSLLARSPEAKILNSTGLYYPLEGLTLQPELSRGISNYFTADKAYIELLSGTLLAVITLFN
ncbi:MAG: thiamine diphosphokinase [Candidatus Cloacimonadota bacterium]